MANEMQGIMGLPEAQPMPTGGSIDPSQFSPVVESYARSNPKEFGQDILSGMAEADPALIEQFRAELASMQLPPEVVSALQLMVDSIIEEPENYDEMRVEFIKEGVPEELLPEQFDGAYFAAFNIAIDELSMSMMQMPAVPEFAKGGIINVKPLNKMVVKTLSLDIPDAKNLAEQLAGLGRRGDSILAHINPQEARMLRKVGGSGTINPKTGLPEFFFKSVFKAVGRAFKGVTKAVKSVVKSVGKTVKKIASSTIGKIALTAAAVYFMGPLAGSLGITNPIMANAVNTFAGSTLVNLASGQKIGDAIKGGVISGAIAGAATGVFNATLGAKQAPAPVVDKSIGAVDDIATQGVVTPNTASTYALKPSSAIVGTPTPSPSSSLFNVIDDAAAPTGFSMPTSSSIAAKYGVSPQAMTATPSTGGISNIGQSAFEKSMGLSNAYSAGVAPSPVTSAFNSAKDFATSAWDKINPASIKSTGAVEAQKVYNTTLNNELAAAKAQGVSVDAAYPQAVKVATAARDAAMPGMIATYGPLAAVGLAGATAMGAFTPPKPVMPQNAELFRTSGSDMLRENPEEYGLNFGGTRTSYAANPYESFANPGVVNRGVISDPYAGLDTGLGTPLSSSRFPTARDLLPPQIASSGGLYPSYMAKGGEAYPRKTGHISGPGTGTSDSVPAMLSDGEFVFTAKAVRAMGQGSRRKGAKRMYALMKQLERKAS
jgi:hypothetical protein